MRRRSLAAPSPTPVHLPFVGPTPAGPSAKDLWRTSVRRILAEGARGRRERRPIEAVTWLTSGLMSQPVLPSFMISAGLRRLIPIAGRPHAQDRELLSTVSVTVPARSTVTRYV